ncbi:MAG: AzlD family protein [Longimicrobiaceae bacterium]
MRTLVALLSMAVGTYVLRAGGFWMMARWRPPPVVERALRHTPEAVLAALVAPAVLGSGWPGLAAAALTAAVALRTKSLLAAIAAGTLTVWLFRFFTQ